MTYAELLKNAPPHESDEFISYLKKHNPVVFENRYWLLIQNCKYHHADKPWYTLFPKELDSDDESLQSFYDILQMYWGWEWLKKDRKSQSVKRFHMHIHK